MALIFRYSRFLSVSISIHHFALCFIYNKLALYKVLCGSELHKIMFAIRITLKHFIHKNHHYKIKRQRIWLWCWKCGSSPAAVRHQPSLEANQERSERDRHTGRTAHHTPSSWIPSNQVVWKGDSLAAHFDTRNNGIKALTESKPCKEYVLAAAWHSFSDDGRRTLVV